MATKMTMATMIIMSTQTYIQSTDCVILQEGRQDEEEEY